MTSKQIRIVAIVLLALAGLLALLAWQVARQPATPAAAHAGAVPVHPVVVTTRAVEAGKPLPADALKVEQLPIDPAGAYREVSRVAGQVPLVNLGAHVPVLESQLLAGLASQVPQGERAVAIAVDEVIGVGNQVQPGDYVDVFLVLRRDTQEVPDSQARMLLSKLRVLAYGVAAVNQANKEAPEQMMTRREGARTAVLSVPLGQVSELAMAQQAGRLLLALRNPKDEATPSEGLFAEPAAARQVRAGLPADAGSAAPDKAAAGVALAGLVGNAPAGAARAPVPTPPAMRMAVAPANTLAPRAQARDAAGVEMIRAGKRDIE